MPAQESIAGTGLEAANRLASPMPAPMARGITVPDSKELRYDFMSFVLAVPILMCHMLFLGKTPVGSKFSRGLQPEKLKHGHISVMERPPAVLAVAQGGRRP